MIRERVNENVGAQKPQSELPSDRGGAANRYRVVAGLCAIYLSFWMICLLVFIAPPDIIWRLLLSPLLAGTLVLAWKICQMNRKAWSIGVYAYGLFVLLVLLWMISVDLNMVGEALEGTPGFTVVGVALQLLLHLSILFCYGVLYLQPSVRRQFRKKQSEEDVA